MSTIGRLFVIVNLLLAGGFLFSGIMLLKKMDNYKTKWETAVRTAEADKKALNEQIAAKDALRSTAEKAKSDAETAKAQVAGANEELKARVQSAENTMSEQRTQLAKIAADLDNFRSNIDSLQKQLTDANKSIDGMREERDGARKAQENAENELATAREANKQLDAKSNSLMAKVNELGEKLSGAETALSVYAERTSIPLSEVMAAPPLITGNVTDVANQLVQLSVGSDSNVKKGYSFSIYRGSEYKGEAIVEYLENKFATARITKVAPGRRIEAGDVATTRLF